MSMNDDDLIRDIKQAIAVHPELGDVPAPTAALERWRQALEVVATRTAPRYPAMPVFRFAAAAVVLGAGIGIAFLALRHEPGPVSPGPVGLIAEPRFERGVAWHLLELESQLAQASSLPVAERADAIRRLAQQNRVQASVAERAGGAQEARSLRAFTVALEDLAVDPGANGDFKGALAQLDFEMKVMQARLASSSPSTGARRLQAL